MPQENAPIAYERQPEMQVEDDFDEAAFDQAFESARSGMQQPQYQILEQDIVEQLRQSRQERSQESSVKSTEYQAWLDHSHIGSDRITDDAKKRDNEQDEQGDADELARTAGQLLENVSGDQSKKFQDSNFLSLMRQIRDKEVRVEGDKLVDVSMPSFTA